jgi:hypothetical protein
VTLEAMATYRMDFVIPDEVDIAEESTLGEPLFTEPIPHPTLEGLRVALDRDSRWSVTRVTPLQPWGDSERQHLLVWVAIARPDAETVLREGLYDIVTDAIPEASLIGIMEATL